MTQKVRRTIAGVEIRRRVVILVKPQIVVVKTKINVEASVVVIIGDGGMSEITLRSSFELEGLPL